MTKCVVAYGNPFDGVQLVGPFSDGNEAGEWADVALRDTEWWLVGLEPTGGAAGRAQRFLHPASPEQGDTEVLLEGLPEAATPDQRWADDSIQFPRLLSEIASNWDTSEADWQALSESTGLSLGQLDELFDRAHAAWERQKASI